MPAAEAGLISPPSTKRTFGSFASRRAAGGAEEEGGCAEQHNQQCAPVQGVSAPVRADCEPDQDRNDVDDRSAGRLLPPLRHAGPADQGVEHEQVDDRATLRQGAGRDDGGHDREVHRVVFETSSACFTSMLRTGGVVSRRTIGGWMISASDAAGRGHGNDAEQERCELDRNEDRGRILPAADAGGIFAARPHPAGT
jgi:hypothetical protein